MAPVAVIYRPDRISAARLAQLLPGVWALPTMLDEPGGKQAARALASGARRVIVAGGDGTLRQVANVLVGTGVPLGIVPVGTGNLLAHNLGLPTRIADAARLALVGEPRLIDVLEVRADGGEAQVCLTMAGVGADAAVLADASERWKRLGSITYLAAGARHLRPAEFGVRIGGRELTASEVLIGNVGALRRGVELLPADPTDRLLDVLIASPRTTGDVLAMIARVLARRAPHARIELTRSDSVQVSLDRAMSYQVDGDVLGRVTELVVAVGGYLPVVSRNISVRIRRSGAPNRGSATYTYRKISDRAVE